MYAIAKALPGIVLFMSVPILTTTFGASIYGQYSRTWAVAVILTALCTGWIQQAFLRTSGLTHVSIRSAALPVRIVAVSVVGCGTAVATWFEGSVTAHQQLVIGGMFGASWAWSVIDETLAQRDGRMFAYTIGGLLRAIGVGALPLVALELFAAKSLSSILLAGAIGAATASVAYRLGTFRDRQPGAPLTLKMFNFGWPMSFWLGLASLLLYTDRWVVAAFVSAESAGLYAAYADLILRGFAMVGMPISLAIHPLVMRIVNTSPTSSVKMGELLKTWRIFSYVLFACVTMLATSFLYLMGPTWLGLGDSSVVVIFCLCVGAGLWQLGLLAHKEHEIAGRTRTMLLCLGVALLLEVSLLFVTTPKFGLEGASLGMMTGALAYVILIRLSRPDVEGWPSGRTALH